MDTPTTTVTTSMNHHSHMVDQESTPGVNPPSLQQPLPPILTHHNTTTGTIPNPVLQSSQPQTMTSSSSTPFISPPLPSSSSSYPSTTPHPAQPHPSLSETYEEQTKKIEQEHTRLVQKASHLSHLISKFTSKESSYDSLMKLQAEQSAKLYNEKLAERQDVISSLAQDVHAFAKEPVPRGYSSMSGGGLSHEEIVLNEIQLHKAAEKDLILVPIRIELEMEGIRFKDTFTWNLNESLISIDAFAKMLCQDMSLPSALFAPAIAKSIQEQIDDFLAHAPEPLKPIEELTRGNNGVVPDEVDVCELRTVIKLDITIDNQTIHDQFEWDIGCRRNDPEAFAEHLVAELGLVPEFKTAIAHSIREQVQQLAKSLLLEEYKFDGSYVTDEDLMSCFLAPVDTDMNLHRTEKDTYLFGPSVNFTSQLEIERMEKDLERDARRKRRQTQRSRRALAITERDTVKTNRTLIPPLFVSEIRYNMPTFLRGSRSPVRHHGPGRPKKPKESSVEPPSNLLTLPAPYVSPMRHWKCAMCQKTAKKTTLIRTGLNDEKNLCNECGLEWNRKMAQKGLQVSNDQSEISIVKAEPIGSTEMSHPSTLPAAQ